MGKKVSLASLHNMKSYMTQTKGYCGCSEILRHSWDHLLHCQHTCNNQRAACTSFTVNGKEPYKQELPSLLTVPRLWGHSDLANMCSKQMMLVLAQKGFKGKLTVYTYWRFTEKTNQNQKLCLSLIWTLLTNQQKYKPCHSVREVKPWLTDRQTG